MAMNICRFCGCTESQARADAMALGLNDEFEKGLYSCCQLVAWADEQWFAWTEAASEDGKPLDQATKPIEIHEAEPEPVLVRVRNKRRQGNESFPQSRNRETTQCSREFLSSTCVRSAFISSNRLKHHRMRLWFRCLCLLSGR